MRRLTNFGNRRSGVGSRAVELYPLTFALCLLASSARASVQAEVGTCIANTGGTQTTCSTGFQGKAVILWDAIQTTAEGEASDALFSMGLSDGTNNNAISWKAKNGQSTTLASRTWLNNVALLVWCSDDSSVRTEVTGVAFNSTPNMVLTFNSNPPGAYKINYLLIGGDEVTNVFVGSDTMPASNGTKSVTNVGFQGDFVLFLTNYRTSSGYTNGGGFGIGAAVSSTRRWALTGFVSNGQSSQPTDANSILYNDECVSYLGGSGSVILEADFAQWTANGFDLDVTRAGSAVYFSYLVVQGGQWDAAVQPKPATATTQAMTGMPFQPKALAVAMSSPTATSSVTANAISSFGAATGTSARAFGSAFHDTSINTVAKHDVMSNAIMHELNATANADFTSFNSDGWTITWDASGTAYQVPWFAVGDNAPAPGGCTIAGEGTISRAGTAACQ
jgi:hypothetical protein